MTAHHHQETNMTEPDITAAIADLNARHARLDDLFEQFDRAVAAGRAELDQLRQPATPPPASVPPTRAQGADGCGTCWACRASDLDDPAARVVRAALDWRAAVDLPNPGSPRAELVAAVDALLAAPACVDLTVGAGDDETAEPTSPADTGETP